MRYERMLEDRRAVVTGGATGMGRAISLLFARHGARVAALDEDERAARELLPLLRAASPESAVFVGDLDDERDMAAMCEAARETIGPADALVCAAALYEPGPMAGIADAFFRRMLEVNVYGAMRAARALLPDMKARRRGDIVLIAPDLAVRALPDSAAVAACAGALYAFARNVTMDYVRYHVRANCVLCPLDGLPRREALTGAPDETDIAHAALWYACDLSRYVVGNALPVDGGTAYLTGGGA